MSLIGTRTGNAPHVLGDAVVIGQNVYLAHRVVRHRAWHIEWDVAPDAVAALLGVAYGKSLLPDDWRVVRLVAGIKEMTVSAHSAACLLAEMPEPVEHGLEKLEKAVSLLRSGLAPEHLSSALRKACRDLPAAPMETMRLMLCERGVMLGKTVVVALQDLPGDRVGLDLQGRGEPILALLSLAANSLRHPRLLDLLEGVSQSLQRGATAQAAIKLAQLGQPSLDHSGAVRALEIADQELRRGLSPFDLLKGMGLLPRDVRLSDWRQLWRKDWDETEHPRVPAGNAGGGEWVGEGERVFWAVKNGDRAISDLTLLECQQALAHAINDDHVMREDLQPPVKLIPGTNIPDKGVPEQGWPRNSFHLHAERQVPDIHDEIVRRPDPRVDPRGELAQPPVPQKDIDI